MKPAIHPAYSASTVTCACGAVHHDGVGARVFNVDICAACHPFYTGKQKLLDTAGRIERFQKKYSRKPL